MMDLRARMLGSWRLRSWDWRDEAGEVDSPLGDDPIGLLMYDDSGRVSVQLMRKHRPLFGNDDWRCATGEEKAAAWIGYFCYFGTFTVDETTSTVTHHIEGSWFPNLIGTKQLRQCTFVEGRLSLAADTPWGRVSILWERP